jgi:hypothetical protein
MYEREELQAQIGEVDEALSKPVSAYLIGGGAMSFAGLKAATKDIDVVVQDASSLTRLSDALKAIGYTSPRDLPDEYASLGAAAYLDREDAPRWDIYVRQVCNCLLLSPGMTQRSSAIDLGLETLDLRRVDPGDVFIFKSITEREADEEDMEDIFARGLDWETVLEEMRWQTANSERAWSAAFHRALKDFSEEGYAVPILDKVSDLAELDVVRARVLQLINSGIDKRASVVDEIDEDADWLEEILDQLVHSGQLVEEAGRLGRPG